jgi:hypothetical protein
MLEDENTFHGTGSMLRQFSRPAAVFSTAGLDSRDVHRLIASGQMTEHGLAEVETAKRDGRWDAAYASAKNMVLPKELLASWRAGTRRIRSSSAARGHRLLPRRAASLSYCAT